MNGSMIKAFIYKICEDGRFIVNILSSESLQELKDIASEKGIILTRDEIKFFNTAMRDFSIRDVIGILEYNDGDPDKILSGSIYTLKDAYFKIKMLYKPLLKEYNRRRFV